MQNNLSARSGEDSIVGYVQFPLSQKGFNEFVGKLLGEPQQVRGAFHGAFIVDMNGIEKLYITIMQRIQQQNKGDLIEFITKIYFDNVTSVTLSGLESLMGYRNIEDLKVIRIELTWNFLIKFEDKEAPEKQTIRIGFDADNTLQKLKRDYFRVGSRITYEINYTARTWGTDIENLIRNAIKTTFLQQNKLKEVMEKVQAPVSIVIPLFIYVILFIINGHFLNVYLNASVSSVVEQIASIKYEEQFSFVAQYIASIPWYKFTTYNNLFLIVMLIVCIVFGFVLDNILDDVLEDKSFIFLESADKESMMQTVKREQGRRKAKYFVTLVCNVVCGVLSNFVFQLLLTIFKIG